MSFLEKPHKHNFQPVAANKLFTITEVLYRCECGELTTKSIEGTWTIEQIQGKTPEERQHVEH